MALASAG